MEGTIIGVENLVFATLLTDPKGGKATYEAPEGLPGLIEVKVNPNTSNDTLFADNGPYDVATALGQISVDINVADLPLALQAKLFGHTMGADGVLRRKSGDTPPWVAVGFKSLKSNGKYRYTWLTKGKFSIPEQDNKTKADKTEFQTPTTTGSFVKREADDEWQIQADEDTVGAATAITNWFNNPYAEAAV